MRVRLQATAKGEWRGRSRGCRRRDGPQRLIPWHWPAALHSERWRWAAAGFALGQPPFDLWWAAIWRWWRFLRSRGSRIWPGGLDGLAGSEQGISRCHCMDLPAVPGGCRPHGLDGAVRGRACHAGLPCSGPWPSGWGGGSPVRPMASRCAGPLWSCARLPVHRVSLGAGWLCLGTHAGCAVARRFRAAWPDIGDIAARGAGRAGNLAGSARSAVR